MAKKKTVNKTKLIADRAAGLAEFAATALVAAEQLRIKTKAIERFPLEETERLIVAHLPALPAKIKTKLTKKNPNLTVAETTCILLAVADSFLDAEAKQQLALVMVAKRLIDCLQVNVVEYAHQIVTQAKKAKPTGTVFQFKITLKDIKPAIWRRIQISDCTLGELHLYIQAAFGWENYHLHQFEINDVRYSRPAPDGNRFDLEFEDETQVMLSDLLPKSSKRTRWKYEYDFGDGWRHEILFEKFSAPNAKVKYPLCLDGERACPPEDCGGPWGYDDFLAALADPTHKRHKERLEWCGPFDPEAFDAEKATEEMRKLMGFTSKPSLIQ